MSTMFWIWMAAALIFLIIELITPTMFFVCFVVGAVASGILAHIDPDSYYWQIGLFVAVSILLLPLTRRFARRITRPVPQKSNVDRMIGQPALVIKAIDPDHGGMIRYEGETWRAVAGEGIEEQIKVRVVAVSGTTVRVEKLEESE